MSGPKPRVNSLKVRKHLLVAESEQNRVESFEELRSLLTQAANLTQQAQSYGLLVGKVAAVFAGLIALRRVFPKRGVRKSSWFSTLLQGARLGTSLWFAIRGRR